MGFVPIVPMGAGKASELAQRITALIEEYRREHPDVSGLEVRRALRTAERQTRARVDPRIAVASVVIVAALGIVAFLWTGGSGDHARVEPQILLVVAAALIALVAAFARYFGTR
ncbi:MAG: hypothetical protein ACE15D_10150 [Candidatus Eisenbacteria bacterium]